MEEKRSKGEEKFRRRKRELGEEQSKIAENRKQDREEYKREDSQFFIAENYAMNIL